MIQENFPKLNDMKVQIERSYAYLRILTENSQHKTCSGEIIGL